MTNHRQLLERATHYIDRIGGCYENSGPFRMFRRRSFIVTLLILGLICLIQAVTALVSRQAFVIFGLMTTLFVLVVLGLIVTRRSQQIETTATVVLSFLVIVGALLEVILGRSPTTPLVFWSPVFIFGAYVFCGIKRGSLVAVFVIISSMAIIGLPFVFDDARILPGEGTVKAYQNRLFITVLLCHILPLLIIGMYEKFFIFCHDESCILMDQMEGRRDRAFLGSLAKVIVGEMEPELERMEIACRSLPTSDDVLQTMDDVLEALQQLVHLTRRYEPLSTGALAAIDQGLTLHDFPEIMKRFTDFTDITLEDMAEPDFRFQGGQAFFLLIFLCMSLRELIENPRLTMQSVNMHHRSNSLEVSMNMFSLDQNLRLSLAQDFLHDMEAKIRFVHAETGHATSRLEINVALPRS